MMTSINTNVGALNARASAVRATTKMEQADGATLVRSTSEQRIR